jgi:hypothetical protein
MQLASPGADDELVVGLHGNHAPEFLDYVGVGIAVECGLNVFGVRAGMQRTFLLPINHHITGLKTGGHTVLLFLLTALRLAEVAVALRSGYRPRC